MVVQGRGGAQALVGLAAALVLAGCGATIPSDPEGTLDRVTGGTLAVGVSLDEPWVVLEPGPTSDDVRPAGIGLQPAGIEVELVEELATRLDAEVEWTVGGEGSLIASLEEGDLDLVVGGLTSTSPWSQKAALTAAFATVRGPRGEDELHVWAAPMGENAFLVEVDRFLLEHRERG
ncbi:transporter substrate-binding domain-containing protein [Cellulomonas sp. APG4]|uniref:transporter substrate-binding domain-containing protein n=1 Tax=Cellulomonas sp. APG4 TaxID=1538656 RepID=UPI001379A885|nr:transporter substrate-binding domain-containing protein [Cellulomonas sp. APG4]NCT89370.1 transporter substrate-binding domain-containing protein [Cellulomonas sp. APG4]